MPTAFLPSTYIERGLTICHILNWTPGIKQRTRKERTGRKKRTAQPCSPAGVRGREGKAGQVAGGRRVLRVTSKFVSGGRAEPEKAYLTRMCMKYYIVPSWDPVSTIYYNVSVGKHVSIWDARETSSYNSLGGVCNRFKMWGVRVGVKSRDHDTMRRETIREYEATDGHFRGWCDSEGLAGNRMGQESYGKWHTGSHAAMPGLDSRND